MLFRPQKRSQLIIIFLSLTLFIVPFLNTMIRNLPVAYNDEFGYWATAAYINNQNWSSVISTIPYYSFGYGLILSIVLLITRNIIIAYKISLILNGVWLCFIFWILIYLFRYISKSQDLSRTAILPKWSTIAIPYILCFYTSLLENSAYSWPEVFLTLLFLVNLFILIKIINTGKLRYWIAIGILNSYLYYVHQRSIGIIISTFLVLILWGLNHKHNSKNMFLATLSFLAIFFLLSRFKPYLMDSMWSSGELADINNMEGQLDKILYVFTPIGFKQLILSLAGKVYYCFGASLFFAPMGLYYLCSHSISLLKERRLSSFLYISLYLILSFITSLGINSLFLVYPDTITHIVYGRYTDTLMLPLIMIGILSLLRNRMSFFELFILTGVFLISCLGVSYACNHSELYGITAINNAGISIFVESQWVTLVKSILFYGLTFLIWFSITRLRKKTVKIGFVLVTLFAYWIINYNDTIYKYDSLWVEISNSTLRMDGAINSYAMKSSKPVKLYALKSDNGYYLSSYPGVGIQFLESLPVTVIDNIRSVHANPDEQTYLITEAHEVLYAKRFKKIYTNDDFSVYEISAA